MFLRDAGSKAARVVLPLCRSGSVRQEILHIELFSSIQQPDVAVVDRDLLRSTAGIFRGTFANYNLVNEQPEQFRRQLCNRAVLPGPLYKPGSVGDGIPQLLLMCDKEAIEV